MTEKKECYLIDNEPGDGTHYRYFLMKNGAGWTACDANSSGIKYPAMVIRPVVHEFRMYMNVRRNASLDDQADLMAFTAWHLQVTPNTLAEVLREIVKNYDH